MTPSCPNHDTSSVLEVWLAPVPAGSSNLSEKLSPLRRDLTPLHPKRRRLKRPLLEVLVAGWSVSVGRSVQKVVALAQLQFALQPQFQPHRFTFLYWQIQTAFKSVIDFQVELWQEQSWFTHILPTAFDHMTVMTQLYETSVLQEHGPRKSGARFECLPVLSSQLQKSLLLLPLCRIVAGKSVEFLATSCSMTRTREPAHVAECSCPSRMESWTCRHGPLSKHAVLAQNARKFNQERKP